MPDSAPTRRRFAGAALGTFLATRTGRAADRPNVLVIISDDLGWNDGGLRVPAIISWPGVLPQSQQHGGFVTVLDWLPTLQEVIGFDTGGEELDGVSVGKNPRDGAGVERGAVVLGGGANSCVYRGEFKLVEQVMGMGANASIARFLFRICDEPKEERDAQAEYPREMAGLWQIPRAHPRGLPDRP